MQAGLVRALTGHAAAPPGFNAARVEAAADALLAKRRRAVARAWPALVHSLGEEFRSRFDAFARTTPLPSRGGPLADGWAFAAAMARQGPLPEAVLQQALAVRLRYRQRKEGLIPRRGLSMTGAAIPETGRLLLGIRLAGAGERWFSLPFPFS
jgi:hypothetical protein